MRVSGQEYWSGLTVPSPSDHPDPDRICVSCISCIGCGLVGNFYSLKTKKIPAKRVALSDCLGCYRVTTGWAFLPNLGSGSLLVMIWGAFGNNYKGTHSVLEMTLFLHSAAVVLVQGLAAVTLVWHSTFILLPLCQHKK